MTSRNVGFALLGFALALLTAGCGAGVAGVAASSGGSSGGGSAPAIVNLRLEGTKSSPARIEFELQNASAEVELRYRPADPSGTFTRMQHVSALPANPTTLAPGPVAVDWTFTAEAGIDPAGGFDSEVEIEVAIVGQTNGSQRAGAGVGNDLPSISSAEADVDPLVGEVSGIVLVEARLVDTPGDRADLRVEFSLDGIDWQLARPAQSDTTPLFAFTNVVVELGGTEVPFFWDTAEDLGDADTDALIRFTPFEDVEGSLEQGTPRASLSFHLDNNAAPVVQLFNDAVISNPDERRGIPVPFRVFDEESDLVETIFQWRRLGEQFPELLEAEIDAVLADPDLRREKHICTEYPRFAHGLVVPIDANTVRLAELARSESWILASGIVGRSLELLRPSSIPEPITPTWASNPLVAPIAVLPVEDGLTALVLDAPGSGRLREIELATGAIVREIATFGPGAPSAMALERGEKAVLVATDLSGVWRIERVELASGAITELIVSDGSQPGPVRGIASLGTSAAVFTAGSALFSLDYRDPLAPQLGTLLSGLATLWGVVVDPHAPNRLYLAEREAVTPGGTGRVLALELDSHGKLPVVVRTDDLQPAHLERPSALALERNGSRMLIVTNDASGTSQLVGLDLGAQGRNVSFPIGPPRASEIASIATGPEELRSAAFPGESEILIGGGLEQRRAIVAFASVGQEVTLDLALQPAARSGWRWRTPAEPRLLARPTGLEAAFVWSSTEDIGGGPAVLRAMARDDELGLATDGRAPKNVRAALDVQPVVLGGSPNGIRSVAAADLDGDGDQDLVSANDFGDNLTVFFQLSPGSFDSTPLALGSNLTTKSPVSVAAADLDGDGDQDLVSANDEGNNLTIFFQVSPGTFAAAPLVVGGPGITNGPTSVAVADLDGDGDQDIVSANRSASRNRLTVFFQISPGSFASTPLVLGSNVTTQSPVSVAAADLDGDGDQDLVSANEDGNNLTVFFQTSPGSFAPTPLALGDSVTTLHPVSVTAADMDGDGDQDLVSANAIGNNLTVFFQESPGSFAAAPLVLGGPSTTNFPVSVAAADLDGDGDQDLISSVDIGLDSGRWLIVFFQSSPGSFDSTPLFGSETTSGYVTAVDLDGDGDQDLVGSASSNMTVFFQSSPGTFVATRRVLGGFDTPASPISVAAADLDGDGDQDLVSTNRDDFSLQGNNTVFFQSSTGSFAFAPLVFEVGASSAAGTDLDGDGDSDLVFTAEGLRVFFQISPGRFAPTPLVLGGSFPTTDAPASVAAADLDGDGDQDLVSAQSIRNNLTVFFQSSPGSFATTPLVLGGFTNNPCSVAAADLDGDGDQDLVSANESGDNLTVFFQSPPGSFATTPLVLGGFTNNPRSVAAGDLDGDGDQDLVSANEGGDSLTVFFQSSPGSFATTPLVLNGFTNNPRSVAVADLDGDGDQDLVSANAGGNGLTVFFQGSPGSFAPTPLVLGGFTGNPDCVAVADLDGDGDQDLVRGDGLNLTVFWGGR